MIFARFCDVVFLGGHNLKELPVSGNSLQDLSTQKLVVRQLAHNKNTAPPTMPPRRSTHHHQKCEYG
jgi:hypothetical protein